MLPFFELSDGPLLAINSHWSWTMGARAPAVGARSKHWVEKAALALALALALAPTIPRQHGPLSRPRPRSRPAQGHHSNQKWDTIDTCPYDSKRGLNGIPGLQRALQNVPETERWKQDVFALLDDAL